jgi:hypothetical protein
MKGWPLILGERLDCRAALAKAQIWKAERLRRPFRAAQFIAPMNGCHRLSINLWTDHDCDRTQVLRRSVRQHFRVTRSPWTRVGVACLACGEPYWSRIDQGTAAGVARNTGADERAGALARHGQF